MVDPHSSYAAHLEALRKTHDVYPWIEPLEVVFDTSLAANSLRTSQVTRNFAMLVADLVGVGHQKDPNAATEAIKFFRVAHIFGPRPNPVPDRIREALALGSGHTRWQRFRPAGLYIPADVPQQIDATNEAAVSAGAGSKSIFYSAFRGYRFFDKGSLQPVQYSYAELAARGYQAVPFRVPIEISVAAAGGEAKTADYTFPFDYAVDAILTLWQRDDTDPNGKWGAEQPNVRMKIEPLGGSGQPFFGDWVSSPLVGWRTLESAWTFPVPITVAKSQIWRFSAGVKTAGNAPYVTDTLTIMLFGNKLLRR